MKHERLDAALRSRILERLGLAAAPSPDLDGLRTLYAAWCNAMPFDNTTKLVALLTGAPGNLPGIDATEFFDRYLAHGVGGTCWPSSNAIFTLVSDLGFDARRVAGSMRDTGVVSHGSVKVRIDGIDWLLDSSMLTGVPLPLTDDLFVSESPLWAAEVELVDGTHVIWWDLPPYPEYIPCRLLHDDATHGFYVERYEASRQRSPFNEKVYVRRNYPHGLLVINGNNRLFKTVYGVEHQTLSIQELEDHLIDELKLSSKMLSDLRDCGALAASMQPAASPPPSVNGIRPTLRR